MNFLTKSAICRDNLFLLSLLTTGVVDTAGVTRIKVNLVKDVTTGVTDVDCNFLPSVNDTGGKVAACIVDTSGEAAKICDNF
jgi:hypothetical protein